MPKNYIPYVVYSTGSREYWGGGQKYIPVHPYAVSDPYSMKVFADWIHTWTALKVTNIVEIGANYGQDAAGLACFFNVDASHVYCFEAHPEIVSEITKLYNFHTFHNAVSNIHNVELLFNAISVTSGNSGVSSLRRSQIEAFQHTQEYSVTSVRMDIFMEEHGIDKIDFLKVDVEGCNWEVLDGFGTRLSDVQCIHLEAEHQELWGEGQKLFPEIESLLRNHNFELVYFQRYKSQSDSFWIQKKWLQSEVGYNETR